MCVGSKGVNPMKRLQAGRLDGALTDYTKNKITFALVRYSHKNEGMLLAPSATLPSVRCCVLAHILWQTTQHV